MALGPVDHVVSDGTQALGLLDHVVYDGMCSCVYCFLPMGEYLHMRTVKAYRESGEYRKSGNFCVKNFHAIIFRVKIFSYASRPYENILTTKIFQ